jgi:hypothetical protein
LRFSQWCEELATFDIIHDHEDRLGILYLSQFTTTSLTEDFTKLVVACKNINGNSDLGNML